VEVPPGRPHTLLPLSAGVTDMNSTLSLSTIFKLGRESRHKKDPLDYGPATMEMLLKDAVVRDFLDEMEPVIVR
jgi:hypothetical protein